MASFTYAPSPVGILTEFFFYEFCKLGTGHAFYVYPAKYRKIYIAFFIYYVTLERIGCVDLVGRNGTADLIANYRHIELCYQFGIATVYRDAEQVVGL